ncbi:mitochondrial carrier domain-containing protein [Panaeolus papilionaceus]|nr:mitochondrial carrier domain-containing protein [Panaeolus papilionaceus]
MLFGDEPPSWLFAFSIVALYVCLWVFTLALTGVLVRFRANYNPKGLQLADANEVEQGTVDSPVVGPVAKSYFGMFARVYRLEGISGLFKGFFPNLIFRAIFNFTPMAYTPTINQIAFYTSDLVRFLLTVIFSIFAMIIIYRAITTPAKLSSFQPRIALRTLLSPHERAHFWKLFRNPGLFLGWTTYIFLVTLFVRITRYDIFIEVIVVVHRVIVRLVPDIPEPPRREGPYNAMTWVILGGLVVLGALLLCPLEVALVRLSLQRNNGPEALSSSIVDTSEPATQPESDVDISIEEDVILTHPDSDPYTGLIDCFKRIVKEEGWTTLYRGWWITFLFGGFKSSFV